MFKAKIFWVTIFLGLILFTQPLFTSAGEVQGSGIASQSQKFAPFTEKTQQNNYGHYLVY